MTIEKHELEKMNRMLESGSNISDIHAEFKKHDYWDIYSAVNDYSLMGKKRMITNRLNKLKQRMTRDEREEYISEIKEQLEEIYSLAKKNGKKLSDVNKIISK